MLCVEFFADKIPGLDSVWDTVHTVVRIPAGALLAAAVFGGDHASWALIAGLMGGTLAATSHLAKASTRAAVNTSPEPFSNIGLSLLGDAAVPTMLWLAWEHPLWFFAALAVAVVLMVALTVVLMKFLRRLLRRWRGGAARPPPRAERARPAQALAREPGGRRQPAARRRARVVERIDKTVEVGVRCG